MSLADKRKRERNALGHLTCSTLVPIILDDRLTLWLHSLQTLRTLRTQRTSVRGCRWVGAGKKRMHHHGQVTSSMDVFVEVKTLYKSSDFVAFVYVYLLLSLRVDSGQNMSRHHHHAQHDADLASSTEKTSAPRHLPHLGHSTSRAASVIGHLKTKVIRKRSTKQDSFESVDSLKQSQPASATLPLRPTESRRTTSSVDQDETEGHNEQSKAYTIDGEIHLYCFA